VEKVLIESLLNEVVNLPKDRGFNIFNVLEISEKEVIICRFLIHMLRPDAAHQCGRVFFDLFFEKVLKGIKKPNESAAIKVFGEKIIDNNRRIDIVIEYDDVSIPIEVKINADDQKDQCSDYVKHARNALLYYLTIDGDEPGNDSNYESVRDKVGLVSWVTILQWLEACILHISKTEKNAEFFDSLCQYKKAVESFVEKDNAVRQIIKRRPELEKAGSLISFAYHSYKNGNAGAEHKAVIDIIQSSPDYTEAAKEISEALMSPQIKAMALEKVDERLQKEHNIKLYHSALQHRTYFTNNEKVFLRLQYSSSESLSLVVCPIVDNGKYKFAGLNGRWAFTEISAQDNFDSLFEPAYVNACADKIAVELAKINNM
jgi:hypothetical protein